MLYNPLTCKLEQVVDLAHEDRVLVDALCSEDVTEVGAKRDIVRNGEVPDKVHLILEGWAARYTVLPDGSRQITAFLIPGDFCDLHVDILEKMDHAIGALTPCRVAHLDPEVLERITSERTALTKGLWRMTLIDSAVLREWIVNVGRRDAYEAVAHILCEMHLRMKAVGLVEDDTFSLPITQEELADATGMTAVHINRTLKRLRSEGLVEQHHREMTVLDVGGLREAGGFNDDYLHLRQSRRGRGHPA
ncbi:Crp/Fnr family transcriptional regulator [Sphingosinicella sp. BN140058]|uniref:Crp/Fnr family transcriptional regulator n=1 Tax=Sphingosinicella sp. BN140058 TaxID=1892855 RepID=UPI001011EC21|nr:Crp/Fnr family transcriptional regulator [Sphingosinicella sp. BN140058]QAY75819.1 Crp/Fnr family transcriptional regulator [Sphingosinicella sp. BN140058]QAY78167.1 Crp/Fnr family transcriptional regulator [Sphingosinicella sp. BN140058]